MMSSLLTFAGACDSRPNSQHRRKAAAGSQHTHHCQQDPCFNSATSEVDTRNQVRSRCFSVCMCALLCHVLISMTQIHGTYYLDFASLSYDSAVSRSLSSQVTSTYTSYSLCGKNCQTNYCPLHYSLSQLYICTHSLFHSSSSKYCYYKLS